MIRPGAGLDAVGLLAAVGANVSFATGVVLTKRFPTPVSRLASTGWQPARRRDARSADPRPRGCASVDVGRNVAGFAYLSLVGTALAFVVWFSGIRRLPTAAPPLLGLAAPITGAILGWAVLGQSLAPIQLMGFVITLAAIAYGARLTAMSGERSSAAHRSSRRRAVRAVDSITDREQLDLRRLSCFSNQWSA